MPRIKLRPFARCRTDIGSRVVGISCVRRLGDDVGHGRKFCCLLVYPLMKR